MTAILFHGKASKQLLLKEVSAGYLLNPESLTSEEVPSASTVKDWLKLLDTPSVGEGISILTLGPVDRFSAQAADACLKALEETRWDHFKILLWAEDFEEVKSTITSRCLCYWTPPEETFLPHEDAPKLLEAIVDQDWVSTLKILSAHEDDLERLMADFSQTLSESSYSQKLWHSIRPVLTHKNYSKLEVVAALTQVIS